MEKTYIEEFIKYKDMTIMHDTQIQSLSKNFDEFKIDIKKNIDRIEDKIDNISNDISSQSLEIADNYNKIFRLIMIATAGIPTIFYILDKLGPLILRVMQ